MRLYIWYVPRKGYCNRNGRGIMNYSLLGGAIFLAVCLLGALAVAFDNLLEGWGR